VSNVASREKVHLSAAEWQMIKKTINHGEVILANSMREVLMGYEYALHQQKKRHLWEKSEIREDTSQPTQQAGYCERNATTCHTLVEGDTARQNPIGEIQSRKTEETARKILTHYSYQSMKEGISCQRHRRQP
jgi:hypothetical protein